MPSIDALPPDQRAVLELVLRRGRTYDEIAQLLSIDRAGVRERALNALDALAPEADVPAERRALITDYLLGALPPRVTEQVRNRLAQSPPERAWARMIAAELESVSSRPLPEIPPDAGAVGAGPAVPARQPAPQEPERAERAKPAAREPLPAQEPREPRQRRPSRRERQEGRRGPRLGPGSRLEPGRERPPSRRGGKLVLFAAAVIVLVVILSLALSGGGGKGKSHSTASTTPTTPTTASTPTSSTGLTGSTSSTGTTGTTGTTGPAAKIVAQENMSPPGGGAAKGVAEVLKAGSTEAVVIIASGLAPNKTHDAYAVWVYNSSSDAVRLGFVSPGVGSSGKLQTEGTLPSNASHFHHLILTLETQSDPKVPGKIVLESGLKVT